MTYPHPFQERFVVRMLGLATTDLCTKFQISRLTHYKDMKGNKKCKNGWFWWLGVTQGHRQHNYLMEYIHVRLPIGL